MFVAGLVVDVCAPGVAVTDSLAALALQAFSGVHPCWQRASLGSFFVTTEWLEFGFAQCACVAGDQLRVAGAVVAWWCFLERGSGRACQCGGLAAAAPRLAGRYLSHYLSALYGGRLLVCAVVQEVDY